MVMALFGAPVDDVDHAEHAVAAAVRWCDELGELNQQWAARRPGRARHRHRHQHRRHDCRQHRIVVDHELHRDRRQREPRVAAGVAQQGIPDPHYHQRRHPHAAAPAPTTSARSATSIVKGKTRAGGDFRGRRSVADSDACTRKQAYEDSRTCVVAALLTAAPGVRAVRRRARQAEQGRATRQTRSRASRFRSRTSARSASRSALQVRNEFGVFQDAAVTKYVTLVGTRPGAGQLAARPELGVHRARHRWRERVRRAGRHRAHHPRRARADQERSGARRRARARDRAHHRRSTRSTSIEKSKTIKMGDRQSRAGQSANTSMQLADAAYDNIVENGLRPRRRGRCRSGGRPAGQQGRLQPGGPGDVPDEADGAQQGCRRSRTACSRRIRRRRTASRRSAKQINAEKLTATAMVAAALRERDQVRREADGGDRRRLPAGAQGRGRGLGLDGQDRKRRRTRRRAKKKGFGLGRLSLSRASRRSPRRRPRRPAAAPWATGSLRQGGSNPTS